MVPTSPSLPSTSCAAWSPGSSSCDSVPGGCGGLVARLAGGVGVERGRDGDAPHSVRSGDELVGVAFQVYRCSTAIEILQYEPAHPDTGHLNGGHNVASAYALDSTAAVEVLALGEEVT